MDFLTYYFQLSPRQREQIAALAGTKTTYLRHVAHRRKRISLGLADALVATSGGALTLDGLPLTEQAQRQRVLREMGALLAA